MSKIPPVMSDKTLSKGLTVLEALAGVSGACGIAELAQKTGLGKSNVHRLLQTLEARGYVRNLGGRYIASLKLWELGCRIINRVDLKQIAHRHMRLLCDVTQETVHLSFLQGMEVIYVDKIESEQPVRAYSAIGGRAPAYCVATGKAMLAYADDGTIRKISESLKSHSSNTITDAKAFKDELDEIRRSGWALNRGEWRQQVWGIASPIRNSAGGIIAAIGISGPHDRFTKGRIAGFKRAVCDAASSVSHDLGFVSEGEEGRLRSSEKPKASWQKSEFARQAGKRLTTASQH